MNLVMLQCLSMNKLFNHASIYLYSFMSITDCSYKVRSQSVVCASQILVFDETRLVGRLVDHACRIERPCYDHNNYFHHSTRYHRLSVRIQSSFDCILGCRSSASRAVPRGVDKETRVFDVQVV